MEKLVKKFGCASISEESILGAFKYQNLQMLKTVNKLGLSDPVPQKKGDKHL